MDAYQLDENLDRWFYVMFMELYETGKDEERAKLYEVVEAGDERKLKDWAQDYFDDLELSPAVDKRYRWFVHAALQSVKWDKLVHKLEEDVYCRIDENKQKEESSEDEGEAEED